MRAHLITLYISEAGAITIVEFLRNAVNSEARRLPRPSARPRRCRQVRKCRTMRLVQADLLVQLLAPSPPAGARKGCNTSKHWPRPPS